MQSTNVLIYCSAGISRSAGIVAGIIMLQKGCSMEAATQIVYKRWPAWICVEVAESVQSYCSGKSKQAVDNSDSEQLHSADYNALGELTREIGCPLEPLGAIGWASRGYRMKHGRITGLGLHGLGLKKIPASVCRLEYLEDLYLYENSLLSIPAIESLASLKRLGLARNGITGWCRQHFPQLIFLNLSRNKIENVKLASSDFEQLRELYLNHNRISKLELEGMQNLKSLYCQHNLLAEVPETIGDFTGLEHLSFEANKLNSLPESIGRLYDLRALNLRGNELSLLPDSLGNLERLKSLSVCDNRLICLPDSVKKLDRLQRINIGLNEELTITDEQEIWLLGLMAENCLVIRDQQTG